jgi:hypothetical protein
MKKLIFILALVFMIIGTATAQTASFATIPASETMQTINTDYTLTNTTVSWFKFTAKKDMSTNQDFQCTFSKGTGNQSQVDVVLYGRKFVSDSWTSIGTGSWQHGVNDSIVTISNTVYNRFREYKAEYTGTGTGTSTIDQQIFKQWK